VPEYQVEESGPDHQKSFRAVVRIGGRVLGSGEGRTKKAAEQQAAEVAWTTITAEAAGKLPPPPGEHSQDSQDSDDKNDQDDGGEAAGPAPGE
jgi:ribonuclease-3